MIKRWVALVAFAAFAFGVPSVAMSGPPLRIVFHNNNEERSFVVILDGNRHQSVLRPRSTVEFDDASGRQEILYTLINGTYKTVYGMYPNAHVQVVDVFCDTRGYDREVDVPSMSGARNKYYGH